MGPSVKIYLLFVLSELIILNPCDCLINKIGHEASATSIKNCAKIFTGVNEYLIKSPNYPKNYDKNLDCVYELAFNGSSGDCPNREFLIQFLDFEIERSENCSNDFLKVGSADYYCGNNSIENFQRSFSDDDGDDIVSLKFHSDGNEVSGKGFMILVAPKKCPEIPSDDSEAERPAEKLELPIFGGKNFRDSIDGQSAIEPYPPPLVTSYLYLPKRNLERAPETDIEDAKKALGLFFLPPNRQNPPNSERWSTYGVPDSLGQEFADNNCRGDNENNRKENRVPNFDPGYQPSPGYPEFPFGDSSSDPSFGVTINEAPSFGVDDWIGAFSPIQSACCPGVLYSSKNFVLSSRGFPSLIRSPSSYECRYTIQRSSQNICGLNLNFKYFNFGSEDRFCAYGYLEIDGERFCGCRTGENFTTSFDNVAIKTISVKSVGYPVGKFSGFVIEVSQESCPPGGYYREESSRIGKNSGGYLRDGGISVPRPRSILTKGSCRVFKFLNWVKAARRVNRMNARCSRNSVFSSGISRLVQVVPVFPENANSSAIFSKPYPSNQNCESVNVVEGTISSIYYPTGYPNDLNRCYRFIKAPGYCQLELSMLDFDLEESRSCGKDYVLFAGLNRRYCGVSLAGSRTIFDLTRSNYAEFYFVTDSSGNGRGFRAGFSQISCSGETPATRTSNTEPINYYY